MTGHSHDVAHERMHHDIVNILDDYHPEIRSEIGFDASNSLISLDKKVKNKTL